MFFFFPFSVVVSSFLWVYAAWMDSFPFNNKNLLAIGTYLFTLLSIPISSQN